MANAVITVGKRASSGPPIEVPAGTTFHVGWTNTNPVTAEGTDPITLMLRLLINTGTSDPILHTGGTNYSGSGTNYDVDNIGVGLGIPQERIDIASFEAIQAQDDYDANIRCNFDLTSDLVDLKAKKFMEDELCHPFGWHILTGNDGRLKLIRPKNPTRFHVSGNNDSIRFAAPASGTTYEAVLTVGVYNRAGMATELARAMNAALGGSTFSASYDTGTNKMSVTRTGGTWDMVSSLDDGWQALGFTTISTAIADGFAQVADNAKANFSGTTLDKNDIRDIRQIDNRKSQITRVSFHYDWSHASEEYTSQRDWIHAESVNLGDILGTHDYLIKSKGLESGAGIVVGSRSSYWTAGDGCTMTRVTPSSSFALDGDSWSKLYAAMLLDRYRQPPIMFKGKLAYEFNTFEVGEVVQLTYDIDGVFVDREKNATTLTTRLFEIVEIHPNFKNGYLDCTFLGHRDTTTPSVVVVLAS